MSPVAKPSEQGGETTKPWVARPHESHRLGRGATRMLCLLGQPPEQWDEEENREHPHNGAVNLGRKGLLDGRRPAPGFSELCAQKKHWAIVFLRGREAPIQLCMNFSSLFFIPSSDPVAIHILGCPQTSCQQRDVPAATHGHS